MGTLALAQSIADRPAAHSIDQIRGALDRLEATATNGGVRNSERATLRLEHRIANLSAELERRSTT